MNFLKKMPIATKIFLIPGIAALSFIIYLLITVYTALNNGATLEKVQKVQFPALQLSASTLVDMQKVRDTLASAVTTGDQDTLTMAQELAEEAKSGLNQIASISPEFRSEISRISSGFDNYFDVAYDVSQSMVNGTADFSRLGELSAQMNQSYDGAIAAMSQFRDAQQAAFEEAFKNTDSANTSLISTGVILAVVVTILLFGTAVPIVRGIKQSIDDVVRSLKDIAQVIHDLPLPLRVHVKIDFIYQHNCWFFQRPFPVFVNDEHLAGQVHNPGNQSFVSQTHIAKANPAIRRQKLHLCTKVRLTLYNPQLPYLRQNVQQQFFYPFSLSG